MTLSSNHKKIGLSSYRALAQSSIIFIFSKPLIGQILCTVWTKIFPLLDKYIFTLGHSFCTILNHLHPIFFSKPTGPGGSVLMTQLQLTRDVYVNAQFKDSAHKSCLCKCSMLKMAILTISMVVCNNAIWCDCAHLELGGFPNATAC